MNAYLFMVEEGYMAVESNIFFVKFRVPNKLSEIIQIIAYNSGCVIIDTNYGEEYIDLKAITQELSLPFNISEITLKPGGI